MRRGSRQDPVLHCLDVQHGWFLLLTLAFADEVQFRRLRPDPDRGARFIGLA